jgi:hypothetical protein
MAPCSSLRADWFSHLWEESRAISPTDQRRPGLIKSRLWPCNCQLNVSTLGWSSQIGSKTMFLYQWPPKTCFFFLLGWPTGCPLCNSQSAGSSHAKNRMALLCACMLQVGRCRWRFHQKRSFQNWFLQSVYLIYVGDKVLMENNNHSRIMWAFRGKFKRKTPNHITSWKIIVFHDKFTSY